MATDYFVDWMLSFQGLLLMLVVIGPAFLLWHIILKESYTKIGPQPLVVGYATALIGLALASFIQASLALYSKPDASDYILSYNFWLAAFNASIYFFILFVVIAILFLGIFGVPLAALLFKKNALNRRNIILSLIAFWIIFSLITWSNPSNQWEETHRYETFSNLLLKFSFWVFCVGGAFLFSISFTAAHRKRIIQDDIKAKSVSKTALQLLVSIAIVISLLAANRAYTYYYQPIPNKFPTPEGAIPFSNEAIRSALLEIRSNKAVIRTRYSVVNHERVWTVSHSLQEPNNNDRYKEICGIIEKHGVLDEATRVNLNYYPTPGAPYKDYYSCHGGGFAKPFLPQDIIDKISTEIKILPGVLKVKYDDVSKIKWKIMVDTKDKEKNYVETVSPCKTFSDNHIPYELANFDVLNEEEKIVFSPSCVGYFHIYKPDKKFYHYSQ